jgi:hypothetical protein
MPRAELHQEYHDLEGRLWTLDRRLVEAISCLVEETDVELDLLMTGRIGRKIIIDIVEQ